MPIVYKSYVIHILLNSNKYLFTIMSASPCNMFHIQSGGVLDSKR